MKAMQAIAAVSCLLSIGSPLLTEAQTPAGKPGDIRREASPAVVNQSIKSKHRETLSLDGVWDFAIDPDRHGESEGWYLPEKSPPSPRRITVPSCWEAQGIGEPGLSSAGVKLVFEPVNIKLRAAYTGAAWYKKTFDIPADWSGKQIWLKLGGVNAQGWFWLNGQYVGHDWSYCGAWKYNVTDLVAPGQKATLAVFVRNDVNSRRGESNCLRTYGGLFRSVEIDATPAVLIDNAYAEPLFDEKTARLHITLRNTTGKTSDETYAMKVRITTASDHQPAGEASQNIMISADATVDAAIDVPLDPFKPWSPESPALYQVEVVLCRSGKPIDGWVERFGMKKFEVRGGDLYLNNVRYFLRGYGDDHVYPVTICSPASREEHAKHLKIAKQYGFNYVRHHTHCEVPEFFEAADEIGMLIQPELPYYGSPKQGEPVSHLSCAGVMENRDLVELTSQYRRYTSLGVYCGGNERSRWMPDSIEMRAMSHRLDASRPWINLDGGNNTLENSDINCYGYGIRNFAALTENTWPHVKHEYMSLGINEDPRLEPKFTGGQASNQSLSDVRKFVTERVGLDWKWAESCLDAGYHLQGVWHKLGIEAARLDPYLDGFNLFLMIDVSPSSQCGVLDMFWDVKKSTAEYFREFNSPTVILAHSAKSPPFEVFGFRPETLIYSDGDRLEVDWIVSHFQTKAVKSGAIVWRLIAGEKMLANGKIDSINAPVGSVTNVGRSRISIPSVARATKAQLIVELEAAQARNSWNVWIFPKFHVPADAGKGIAASPQVFDLLSPRYPGLVKLGTPEAEASRLIIAENIREPEVVKSLEQGKRVLCLSLPQFDPLQPGYMLADWAAGISNQTGTAIAAHPAFGDFPNDGYVDQGWFRLIDRAEKLDDGHKFKNVEPLMIGIGRASKYRYGMIGYPLGFNLYAFQARAGNGKLLATGLNLAGKNPEAVYLLDQLIRYTGSEQFQPQGSFNISFQQRSTR